MKFWIVNKAATADAIIAAVEAGKCTSDWQIERIAIQHGDKVVFCKTAIEGKWVDASGDALFDRLPDIWLIAEDLGDLCPKVLKRERRSV